MVWRFEFDADLIVWIVAFTASLDALTEAAQGFVDHRLDHLWLWIGTSAMIFAMAVVVETHKAREVAS